MRVRLRAPTAAAARAPAAGASAPTSRRPAPLPAPTSGLDTRLRRAHLLGHRLPVVVRERTSNALQRLLFTDFLGNSYDPDTLGLTELHNKLAEWWGERNAEYRNRWSRLPDQQIDNRISQLQLQIEVTKERIGRSLRKARLGQGFVDKHLIYGDALNATTLQESIQKSIDFNRWLNTVLHLTPDEVKEVRKLAMRTLEKNGYPTDMIKFKARVGVVTQYAAPTEENRGVLGDFTIHSNTEVTLGVLWNDYGNYGLLMHLDAVQAWPCDASYSYSKFGGREYLSKVYGNGPDTVNL